MKPNTMKFITIIVIVILIFSLYLMNNFYLEKINKLSNIEIYKIDSSYLHVIDSLQVENKKIKLEIDSLSNIKPSYKYVERKYNKIEMDSIFINFINNGL